MGRLIEYEEIPLEERDEEISQELLILAHHRNLSLQDDIVALQSLDVLRRDVAKARAYRGFPFYILFLLIVTIIPWMSRLSNSRYNELYHLEKANQQELLQDTFMAIDSVARFWDWYTELSLQV